MNMILLKKTLLFGFYINYIFGYMLSKKNNIRFSITCTQASSHGGGILGQCSPKCFLCPPQILCSENIILKTYNI